MAGVTRFGVSIDGALLKSFDQLITRKGYRNRSEALRDLVRDNLVQEDYNQISLSRQNLFSGTPGRVTF